MFLLKVFIALLIGFMYSNIISNKTDFALIYKSLLNIRRIKTWLLELAILSIAVIIIYRIASLKFKLFSFICIILNGFFEIIIFFNFAL